MTGSFVHLKVWFDPGIPDRDVASNIVNALVDAPMFTPTSLDGGPNVGADPAEEIVDAAAKGRLVAVVGEGGVEATVSWSKLAYMNSNLSLHVPAASGVAEAMASTMVSIAETTQAPLAVVHHQNGFSDRTAAHRTAAREAGPGRRYNLTKGLAGVAWETHLGGWLHEFFVGQNPGATDHRQVTGTRQGWRLSCGGSVEDWLAESYGAGEKELISVLGPAWFYDPATGQVARALPSPPHAQYRCRTWDPFDQQWTNHDGAPPSPVERLSELTWVNAGLVNDIIELEEGLEPRDRALDAVPPPAQRLRELPTADIADQAARLIEENESLRRRRNELMQERLSRG